MSIILGLGSNLGLPLDNLRQAYEKLCSTHSIKVLQVSSIYQSDALLPPNAPSSWDKPFLNLAIKCETSLTPQELLAVLQTIEESLGRIRSEKWAPRLIDIDILAWDNLVINQDDLHIPHLELLNRSFALVPLLDLLPYWQHPQKVMPSTFPSVIQKIPHRIDTPSLVGIINVTPDSFSDGGLYNDVESALQQAQKLFLAGAEVIDIGGESTRPGATSISAEQEWIRISPLLQELQYFWKQSVLRPKISVDTRHLDTIEKVLAFNVDWINHVSGDGIDKIGTLLKGTDKRYVVMHHLGVPPDRNVTIPHEKALPPVYQYGLEKIEMLLKQGLKPEQLIFDMGIGFGKTPRQSIELLKNIEPFKNLNVALMVGHSRKSFLELFTEKKPSLRDFETLIVSLYLAHKKVNYLRIHDVALHEKAFRILSELTSDTV